MSEEKEKSTDPANKEQPIPEASFILFISGLATQAFILLGVVDNPITKKNEQNLGQAKYTIDTMQILQEKTKGNLSDDENKYLDNILHDLRSRYLEKTK